MERSPGTKDDRTSPVFPMVQERFLNLKKFLKRRQHDFLKEFQGVRGFQDQPPIGLSMQLVQKEIIPAKV
jgi:hypothetical protein